MEQKKVSSFRQTGWKEVATGVFHIFYGQDMPVQDGTYTKVWDILVTTETTTQHMIEPAIEAAHLI